jgi:hypothetical protein
MRSAQSKTGALWRCWRLRLRAACAFGMRIAGSVARLSFRCVTFLLMVNKTKAAAMAKISGGESVKLNGGIGSKA